MSSEGRKCSRCGEIKIDFPYKKPYCRDCGNEMCRNYKRRNKEKISEYNKKYKEEHKDEISEYNHNYNIENREVITKRQTITNGNRRKTDENFRLSISMRRSLYKFVKQKCKTRKEDKIKETYGCSSIFFKKWLEFQFTNDFNWDNYGTIWSIDHIKPCCLFDFRIEEHKKEGFHWTNLRPLSLIENQKKTNKLDMELIQFYKELSNKFKEECED